MAAMTQQPSNQGFALLVAVIFTSVMLAFSLLIGTLAYKQAVLANHARDSQYAFYAADAGLECLLRSDFRDKNFQYLDPTTGGARTSPPANIACGGNSSSQVSYCYDAAGCVDQLRYEALIDLAENRCARVTIYKPQPGGGYRTFLFSEGYNTSCSSLSTARYAARGIRINYR